MRCPDCKGHGWSFVGFDADTYWTICKTCRGHCRVSFIRWLAHRLERARVTIIRWFVED